MAKAANDDSRMRAVKSRQKKLDDRWGLEKSVKGTRFKLNRDLAGYFLTSREEIVIDHGEREPVWKLNQPAEIKGSLITLENVNVGYPKRKNVLEGVNLVIHPGSRISIVGSVSMRSAMSLTPERSRKVDLGKDHDWRAEGDWGCSDDASSAEPWVLFPTCRRRSPRSFKPHRIVLLLGNV